MPETIAGHGTAWRKMPDKVSNTAFAGWRRSLAAHMADEMVSQIRQADHWRRRPRHYR
jgi:hypothetical protein